MAEQYDAVVVTDLTVLRRMRIARDTMDREWSHGIDVDTVTASAGYSRYHFIRLFRRTYGEFPGQYLSRRRVERAAELLRSANLMMTEICLMVGFTSLGASARSSRSTPRGARRNTVPRPWVRRPPGVSCCSGRVPFMPCRFRSPKMRRAR